MDEVRGFGCGARVRNDSGLIHAYIDASPGCWELFCSLQDWKSSLPGVEGVSTAQYLVDAYATQHPSNSERRNRQSVAVHLMSLCASLEMGFSGFQLRTLKGTWAGSNYPRLTPAPKVFAATVRDVADASIDIRTAVVVEMAQSSWLSWSDHHDEVRAWLETRSS